MPQAIRDLSAQQSGNDVVLTFAIPTQTIDRRTLPETPTIEIYRSVQAASGGPSSTPSPALLATIPSAVVANSSTNDRFRYVVSLSASDFLPNAQTVESFSVRTRVSDRKESESSNVVQVPIYPAPDPINDLQAQVVQYAIDLTWTPPQETISGTIPSIAGYHVYRANAEPSSSPAPPPSSPSASHPPEAGAAAAPNLSSRLVEIAETSTPNYRDASAQLGQTYAYSVRAAIQVPGKLLESDDSNIPIITLRDVLPPAAPTGLVAVPVPAEAGTPAHLDLSWDINSETNIAGYNVYRSEGGATAGTRLNSELLPTPTFRDMNAVPGRRYFYTVTAVDRSGNESSPSLPVESGLPAESP